MSEKLLMEFHFQAHYLTNIQAPRRQLSRGGLSWWTTTGPSSAGPSWTWTSPGSQQTTPSKWERLFVKLKLLITHCFIKKKYTYRQVKSCVTSSSQESCLYLVQPLHSPLIMFSLHPRLCICPLWKQGGTTTSRGPPTASGKVWSFRSTDPKDELSVGMNSILILHFSFQCTPSSSSIK